MTLFLGLARRTMLCSLIAIAAGCSGGCSSSDIRMGNQVNPPGGYSDLCQRTPDVPECGGK